jgi:hypothetical protein
MYPPNHRTASIPTLQYYPHPHPMHLPPKLRRLVLPLILLLCLLFSLHLLVVKIRTIPSGHLRNLYHSSTPRWILNFELLSESTDAPIPNLVPSLLNATWPGDFPAPQLSLRTHPISHAADTEAPDTPALLMLHIFSTPSTPSRRRRQLIRKLSPLRAIPEAYRQLVEIKFVLGYPEVTDLLEEEAIEREMGKWGDLVRLTGLVGGENMNEGKTWEWVRCVGREGGRQAQWVL